MCLIFMLLFVIMPLPQNSFHLSDQLFLVWHVQHIARSKNVIGQPSQCMLYLFCSSQIRSTAMSAGLTPEMRLAWPMDRGRISVSF